jgi:long-chain acyl-CoA synthetase
MSANLAKILTDSAERDPGATALRLDDAALSYAMLDEASARVAGLLAGRGVGPGDRVGLMLPNVPYFAAAYYGILRLGAVVVPMNVLLKAREVGFYLADPAARLVFAWHDFADAAQAGATEAGAELVLVAPGEFEQLLAAAEPRAEVAGRAADDTAVILYTSGTTGKPKGAELTHDNLRRNADAARGLFGLGAADVALGALPLFHSFGQTCGLNATISGGGCLTLIPRFDPGKALEIIQRDRVGVFEGVPTMYAAMLHLPDADAYDTSSLRICVSGGSAMPVEVMRAFEERFGCKVLEGYGLSETSPVASFNHPDRERKPGSIGTPIAGVEMKAVDEDGAEVPDGEVGEIVIRGHNVMKGYWERPEATAEAIRDGWLHTGDLGRLDVEGYLYIADRRDDLIVSGGENVYPAEVESVLLGVPGVRECAVVGLPDERWGQIVTAFIKRNAAVDEGALHEFCRASGLANFKRPRRYVFVEAIPKSPVGKLLRRMLVAGDYQTEKSAPRSQGTAA